MSLDKHPKSQIIPHYSQSTSGNSHMPFVSHLDVVGYALRGSMDRNTKGIYYCNIVVHEMDYHLDFRTVDNVVLNNMLVKIGITNL